MPVRRLLLGLLSSLVVAVLVNATGLAHAPSSASSAARPAVGTSASLPPPRGAPGPAKLLSWSAGQALPDQNGRAVPPPVAPPVACRGRGSSCTDYHWYAGGDYNASTGATEINRTFGFLTVPRGPANDHQFYYVLVSIWDSSGSYDQLGFSDDDGVWGLTESFTTGSCLDPTYWFLPDAVTLSPDRYVFEIDITGGLIHFLVGTNVLNLGSVWDDVESPGSFDQYLSTASEYCDSYGYTLYEEVYSDNATNTPTYSFEFRDWKQGPQTGPGGPASFSAYYDDAPTSNVAATVIELYGLYNNVALDNDID
jgi:hypothetical protein